MLYFLFSSDAQPKVIRRVSSHFNSALVIEILDTYEVQLHDKINQSDLQGIIKQLVEEDVLPGSVLDGLKRCHHAEDAKKLLFSEVRKVVEMTPKRFEVFAKVLKKFGSSFTIGIHLLSEYCELNYF